MYRSTVLVFCTGHRRGMPLRHSCALLHTGRYYGLYRGYMKAALTRNRALHSRAFLSAPSGSPAAREAGDPANSTSSTSDANAEVAAWASASGPSLIVREGSPVVNSLLEDLNGGDVPLGTPADVEAAFSHSVQARTVSNVQLRRFIQGLLPNQFSLALAAVKGAKTAGLRINAHTYESLLHCLMDSGQLRASMELYQQMVRQRMTPTADTYAVLMEMCLQREMTNSCQSLFHDMQKRGVRPTARNCEIMITSLSLENPPQWEKAIEVFDKISRERRSRISAATYNALMRVYLNMRPFDWRVVYNCYNEMRHRRPRVPLEWESYLIVREALVKGQAGYVRRSMAYLDAWAAVTPLRSWNFFFGACAYLALMTVLKTIIGSLLVWYYESTVPSTSDSVLTA